MVKNINPIRETDAQSISLAARLIADERYGALGVLEATTGVPLVSRIACAHDVAFGLFFAASDLSMHSKCLLENSTCSLLLGEPGKGDGLAHPRITLIGTASRMQNDDPERARYRSAFLKIHPKAELYIDFADFGFYPLILKRAYLNGGFGKAYHLEKADLEKLFS
ncbi:MAG: pyridoxamine 5-phosphate oxidase [Pseudomonadota bacterium]